jgi:ribonuclease-3
MEPPKLSVETLNSIVGTKIKNKELYQRAFTHKSALKRYTGLTGSYETLEFMGDSVLGFIITKHLFDLHEKEQEGFLTKARTKMVRGKTLCEISKVLGLDKLILMDEKGERNEWNTNEHIMEDAFEALVGAIYLDLGMVHAKNFVLEFFPKSSGVS